jgi:hypothetical protein
MSLGRFHPSLRPLGRNIVIGFATSAGPSTRPGRTGRARAPRSADCATANSSSTSPAVRIGQRWESNAGPQSRNVDGRWRTELDTATALRAGVDGVQRRGMRDDVCGDGRRAPLDKVHGGPRSSPQARTRRRRECTRDATVSDADTKRTTRPSLPEAGEALRLTRTTMLDAAQPAKARRGPSTHRASPGRLASTPPRATLRLVDPLGAYTADRAAALSGVPRSTIHWWARERILVPSVSPSRQRLWSFADLMGLRTIYWLRRGKTTESGVDVPATSMGAVRAALVSLAPKQAIAGRKTALLAAVCRARSPGVPIPSGG